MRIAATLDGWTNALKGEGMFPKGIVGYRRRIERFADWLDTNPAVDDICPELIVQYAGHLAHTCAPKTIGLALTSIRSYSRYAVMMKWLAEDPTARIRWPKYPKPKPRALSTAELHALGQALRQKPYAGQGARTWARNRRAIALMLYGGLRIFEACNVQWAHIELDQRVLHVIRGKGAKDRDIPIADVLYTELTRVPEVARIGFVCGRRVGAAIGPKSLAHIFERWLPALGVEGITAHRLRHTCATQMRNNGVALEAIQTILGHESLETTAIYLGMDVRQLRDAVNRIPSVHDG